MAIRAPDGAKNEIEVTEDFSRQKRCFDEVTGVFEAFSIGRSDTG